MFQNPFPSRQIETGALIILEFKFSLKYSGSNMKPQRLFRLIRITIEVSDIRLSAYFFLIAFAIKDYWKLLHQL